MKSSDIDNKYMMDNGCKTVSTASHRDPNTPNDCNPCEDTGYPCIGCSITPCLGTCEFSSPSNVTNCICNADNCNPSDIVEPIMSHLAHVFAVLISSQSSDRECCKKSILC